MDYFVNRDKELDAFKDALNVLFDKDKKPPILLFHGASGMGKTWLIQQCDRIAKEHRGKPFTIYVDCNRTNMTLEVLFNKIHTALEIEFKKYFKEYIKFLEKIDDIENKVEEEANIKPDNAQKIAAAVSAVASKAIAATVPGAAALVGEKNIKGTLNLVTGGIAEGITSLRRQFASHKLDREKYRFFHKDLQAEQCKKLAEILNKIADKESRKLILFVDRFEKLVTMPNVRSDVTFYEYWRENVLNHFSSNILLVQGGRMDFGDDYQLHLRDRVVKSFELKPFTEEDILKILSHLEVVQIQIEDYRDFVKLLIEKTLGYPVAVGLLKGQIQGISSIDELKGIEEEVLRKETRIIDQSIGWILDNSIDPQQRETVYKLAVCCTRSGAIDKKAIKYIFGKSDMSFPQVEAAIRELSQQYSFIDSIQWTMHELVRKFILRHLKLRDKDYIRQINSELRLFFQGPAEEEITNGR